MDFAASRRLVRNRRLRPLMTAWGAFYTADLAHFTLMVVFSFSVGGVPAVGAANVLNMLPGGLLAPLAAALASSPRPQLHLAMGIGARIVMMVATIAVVLTGAPLVVFLALVGIDSLVSAAVRPLHGALVVRLADSASDAAAANAATSTLLSVSALLGPALASVALALLGIGWAFLLPALLFAAGTVAALSIGVPGTEMISEPGGSTASKSALGQLRAMGAGFRGILASRPATAAAGLLVVSMMLAGVWDVASASVAGARLGLGEGGITAIMTFTGAGALLGAVATLSIVGRRGLSRLLAGAMLGWAVTFAAIGLIFPPQAILLLAAGVGACAAAAYAIAPTLVQRSVAKTAMVSSAATLHSLYLVATAAGAMIAPVLIGWVGVSGALFTAGATVAVITALAWPQLRRADALSAEDAANLAVIRATPMLSPLTALVLEQLARASTRVAVPKGSEVIRQGDRGNRFYMIAAGLADVTVDGQRVATLGPGGSFGEIALMEDVGRSATVTAREDLDLVTVARSEFLGALSSNRGASQRLGGAARARLATRPVEERLVELDRQEVLDDRPVDVLLASQPPLATLPAGAVRDLAAAARVLVAPDGALIIREGDYGDAYYVIVDGAAEVLEGETAVRKLYPGNGFGEQAIMRDIPRTATVRALGDTTLVAVNREAFQRARSRG